MKSKIITPIYYVGGTGGHFLSAILNSAKLSDKEPLNFSEFGNAHATKYGLNQLFTEKNLERFTKYSQNELSFISTHTPIDFLLNNFNNLVVITYDKSDIPDITSTLVMKVAYTNGRLKEIIPTRKIAASIVLSRSIGQFDKMNSEKIFYVCWKDLYKLEADLLIDMLHKYTNIPKENFNINSIHEWRRLTTKSIELCNEFCP